MFLIVGLGNPTARYEKTRHNVGFEVIDALAAKYHIDMRHKKGKALCGSGVIGGQKVLLAKPQTYMNLSGDSVRALLNFYRLDAGRDLIVVSDDISLEPGSLRVRQKGSAGGHNGLKDIIAKTGSDQFARIRVGVGGKPDGWDLADYVLSRFGQHERERVEEAEAEAVEAAALLVQGRAEEAMNRYNRRKETGE